MSASHFLGIGLGFGLVLRAFRGSRPSEAKIGEQAGDGDAEEAV